MRQQVGYVAVVVVVSCGTPPPDAKPTPSPPPPSASPDDESAELSAEASEACLTFAEHRRSDDLLACQEAIGRTLQQKGNKFNGSESISGGCWGPEGVARSVRGARDAARAIMERSDLVGTDIVTAQNFFLSTTPKVDAQGVATFYYATAQFLLRKPFNERCRFIGYQFEVITVACRPGVPRAIISDRLSGDVFAAVRRELQTVAGN